MNVIRILHEAYPELHLKAWTAVEIDWFCRLTEASRSARCCEDMIDAGLGSLPGGGAEIFHPEVRDQICEHKADAGRWLDIHRTAHELGLRSNARCSTATSRTPYHRIDHLIRLRELQDETGGFQTFIPLAFHPDNTGLAHIKKPSSLMDLRTMAVSRLMLDNFAAHQGVLDHARHRHGPGRAGLRGRRPRRHGAARADLSRRRRDDAGNSQRRSRSAG